MTKCKRFLKSVLLVSVLPLIVLLFGAHPLLATGAVRHSPEVELDGSALTPAGFGRALITILLTYLVWHGIPHACRLACDAYQRLALQLRWNGLGAELIAQRLGYVAGRLLPQQSLFPRVGKYFGTVKSKGGTVRLTIVSGVRAILWLAGEEYDLKIDRSDPSSAVASGVIQATGHGGNVGSFTLTRNHGVRSNELILLMSDGDDLATEAVLQRLR